MGSSLTPFGGNVKINIVPRIDGGVLIMESYSTLDNCVLGDHQVITQVGESIFVNIFSLDGDLSALHIVTSESYGGNSVGHGTVWAKEAQFSYLLAVARLLEWDHNLNTEHAF